MKLPLRVKMLSEDVYADGKIDPDDNFTDRVDAVLDADGQTVIYTESGFFKIPPDDAARIAFAVNHFDEMVTALRFIKDMKSSTYDWNNANMIEVAQETATEALAKLEPATPTRPS
jgi:hypothetical protein